MLTSAKLLKMVKQNPFYTGQKPSSKSIDNRVYKVLFTPDRVVIGSLRLQSAYSYSITTGLNPDTFVEADYDLLLRLLKSASPAMPVIINHDSITCDGMTLQLAYDTPSTVKDFFDSLSLPIETAESNVQKFVLYGNKLKNVARFCSNDNLRPVLTCLCVTPSEIVATDAHILFRAPYPDGFSNDLRPTEEYLLPSFVANFVGNRNAVCDYVQNTNCIFSRLTLIEEPITFFFKREDADKKYPNYKAVFPDPVQMPIHLKYSYQELKSAVTKALSMSYSITNLMKFKLNLVYSEISSEDNSDSSNANLRYNTRIMHTVSAFPDSDEIGCFQMGINARLLLKIINELDPLDAVSIRFTAPNKAIVVNDNILLMSIMLD